MLAKLWRDPSPYRERVRAVAGDVTQPGPRASPPPSARALAEDVGAVLHCAASISFDLPLDEARAINVEGTREVIGFAREGKALGRLDRFVHVSTAYVAGKFEGTFRERQLDAGQEFRNTYEQTKWEAEHVVSEATDLQPGDRPPEHRHGRVRLRLDAGVQRPVLAAARVLARAVRRDPGAAVGARRRRAGRLRRRRARAPARRARPGRLQPRRRAATRRSPTSSSSSRATASTGRAPEVVPEGGPDDDEHGAVYLPYFDMEVVFDDSRTRPPCRAWSARRGCPTSSATLMDYAEETRWGKRAMTREEARERVGREPAAA